MVCMPARPHPGDPHSGDVPGDGAPPGPDFGDDDLVTPHAIGGKNLEESRAAPDESPPGPEFDDDDDDD